MNPWGQAREDIRVATLSALIANVMGGKKSDRTAWKPEEFLLRFEREDHKPLQSANQIEALFKTWVDANNLRFRNKEIN